MTTATLVEHRDIVISSGAFMCKTNGQHPSRSGILNWHTWSQFAAREQGNETATYRCGSQT
ncbi:MAG: hypothetical protein ACRDRH_27560 [Pseudonocardia sp.]